MLEPVRLSSEEGQRSFELGKPLTCLVAPDITGLQPYGVEGVGPGWLASPPLEPLQAPVLGQWNKQSMSGRADPGGPWRPDLSSDSGCVQGGRGTLATHLGSMRRPP
jgi:hypothetical protein